MRITILVIICIFTNNVFWAQDKFADIGTANYSSRTQLLEVQVPDSLPEIVLPLEGNRKAAFKEVKSISTSKELYAELDKMRLRYAPFMQNLAPEVHEMRQRTMLDTFQWRMETEEDKQNFGALLEGKGNWKTVKIPHYGEPLGRATTYYFKEIKIDSSALKNKLLYIHFKGVDYKTSVFVNNRFIGQNEGFFAPFEFEIGSFVKHGNNRILVKVDNDFPTTSMKDDKGNTVIGDKIYGATGPGYDEPNLGWHHCPPAMGIYQDCYLEIREKINVNDVFVRPLLNDSVAEVWLEINDLNPYPSEIKMELSVFGQNFRDTVVFNFPYTPHSVHVPGVGDLTKPTDWQKINLKTGFGVNQFKISLPMGKYRLWSPDEPWLYQLQVKILNNDNKLLDIVAQQFGMRSFTQDTVNVPKGKLFLNGEMIRLRGANTMGQEQQCVIRKDWDQLRDDILFAKLANMNFLRFTQRPVQTEVYEMCDKLGLLNQTDLPFFGTVRFNKFAEAVKQAEAMERLVRKHPSTIMVTYINERFPNGEGLPQRSINNADDYNKLFKALDQAVLYANPDRVIKAGDGDYDPPSPGLPDYHNYNTWYNGHGLGLGEMYKGYWLPVKKDWAYACGEFGSEGLDHVNIMYKYYPKHWLPANKEDEKNWTANRIPKAQTHKFHYMWYNTQNTLADWVEASQDYQARATKFVAESFRRNNKMVSFAIHLFIDAWPAGWMKTIMDVDRQPKKAFFAYRNALEPLMISLRSDRDKFFAGETTNVEIWVSNDKNTAPDNLTLHYQIEDKNGKILSSGKAKANCPLNGAAFQGYVRMKLPEIKMRTTYQLRAALVDNSGKSIYQNKFEITAFPKPVVNKQKIFVSKNFNEQLKHEIAKAGFRTIDNLASSDVVLIDDYKTYIADSAAINQSIREGKLLLFTGLQTGIYKLANTSVEVNNTTMGKYYFASPNLSHPLLSEFKPLDFNNWYSAKTEMISPLLAHTFYAKGWSPILKTGNSNWVEDKGTVMAAGEIKYGKGTIRVNLIDLNDKLLYNPTALIYLNQLLIK